MRIGELARACDCPTETIRYFEKIGLLPPTARAHNGYRIYDGRDEQILRFILRGRELGFCQQDVRRLVDLASGQQPACADVHDMLGDRLTDVRDRIAQLQRMEQALRRLQSQCRNGTLNDCPVIEELLA